MTRRDQTLDQILDDAVARVRADGTDPEQVARAADRVWERLSHAAPMAADAADADAAAATGIEGCDGFRALIPDYLAGTLSAERRLLLEDHSRECVPCRRALKTAREGTAAPAAAAARSAQAPAPARSGYRRWLLPVAAALIAAVGLAAGWMALTPGGEPAVVASIDGALLTLADDGAMRPLAVGDEIAPAQAVRTAKGSAAVVELADGTQIELRERTEMAVARRLRGTTVRLDRGNIIVEAAEQHDGRLYVSTDDCLVSVVGTIFAVNHGVKGSRVSVIEGEVRVDRGHGPDDVLLPGDQITTRASLAAVPVAEEVAWSRHNDHYVELLRELTALRQALDEGVERPGLRYAARLTGAVPASAAVYIALPNLGGQIADTYQVFREQLATSPLLAEWWAGNGAESEAEIERAVTTLSDLGSYLGDEVVVAMLTGEEGVDAPVLLAETLRPGLDAFLAAEAARLEAEAGEPVLSPISDPAEAVGDGGLWVLVGNGLLIASPDPQALASAAATAAGNAPAFGGALAERVEAAYGDGVEWLFAADFAGLIGPENAAEMPEGLGFDDLAFVVVEHRGDGDRAVTSAEVSFAGPRHGLASWLGAPAPMGSLEFVSPQAAMAAAAVTKDPEAMLADILGLASHEGEGPSGEEAEQAMALVADIAASLGGEVALALDGPLLPEPAWKMVAEVYDAGRLQTAIEQMVALAAEHGGNGPAITAETSGGRTVYHVTGPQGGGAYYLYSDGYLVAAPSVALLDRALDARAAGTTLPASAAFRELLPADGHANFSGLFYQHLGPVLEPVAGQIAGLAGGAEAGSMGAAQAQALAELAAEGGPTLGYAYGESDRIVIAATGPRGPFGLAYRALLGVGGLEALAQTAGGVHHRAEVQ